MKKIGFKLAMLYLVMHGVATGMMTRTKIMRGVRSSRKSHCAAGIASVHNAESNVQTNEVTLLLESLQIVRRDIEKQTKLLEHLQRKLAEVENKKTKSYDLEVAKIEAKCKIFAAQLPYGEGFC